MKLIHNKLASVLKYHRLDQKEVSDATGIFQSSISRIVNGDRSALHPALLEYLIVKKVNLNALLDESVTVEEFEEMLRNPVVKGVESPGCQLCAEKDQRIRDLNRHIDLLTSLMKPEA